MGVSKNRGTPKSSILIGFSIINHPFWGTTIFGNTHINTPPQLATAALRLRLLDIHWHRIFQALLLLYGNVHPPSFQQPHLDTKSLLETDPNEMSQKCGTLKKILGILHVGWKSRTVNLLLILVPEKNDHIASASASFRDKNLTK